MRHIVIELPLFCLFMCMGNMPVYGGALAISQRHLSSVFEREYVINDEPVDTSQVQEHILIREDSSGVFIENDNKIIPSVIPDSPGAYKSKKRWPSGALLRSAVVPGWGQFYNRNYIKAVIYGGVEIGLIMTTRKYWRQMNAHQYNFLNSSDAAYQSSEFRLYQNSRDNRNLYLWLTGLTVLVSMFDAFVDAHLADFNQTDKAFEVQVKPQGDNIQVALVYNFR